MARKQAQGGNRGQKGSSRKPKGRIGSESRAARAMRGTTGGEFNHPQPAPGGGSGAGNVGSDAEATKSVGGPGDAASRPRRGDPDDVNDSFVGDVSSGEAAGPDSR